MERSLQAGTRVFSHLGMTGKWVHAPIGEPNLPFEKVRLDVSSPTARRSARTTGSVRYLDPRLFGRFVVRAKGKSDLPIWSKLGPDPLLDGIDLDAFHAKLARRKLAIKPALLDQTVLAGVGNIQATEALFSARIDPRRPARDLSRKELAALARAITRSIAKTSRSRLRLLHALPALTRGLVRARRAATSTRRADRAPRA